MTPREKISPAFPSLDFDTHENGSWQKSITVGSIVETVDAGMQSLQGPENEVLGSSTRAVRSMRRCRRVLCLLGG